MARSAPRRHRAAGRATAPAQADPARKDRHRREHRRRAHGGAKAYRVELATDVAFLHIIEEAQTEESSISFALPPNATFFVRLTAVAISGLEGLPGIYAPGVRRASPPAASEPSADATGAAPPPFRLWAEPRPLPIRLTGHGTVQPLAIAARTSLR
ncbi:hypothetical protein ACFSTI_28285 [Rhizorhabdus histidinilytica]